MQLLDFTLSVIALALIPGPDILFVMANAINIGWKKAMYIVLGMSSGNVIYTIFTCLGFGKLALEYPTVLNSAKYFGAAYLLHLGIMGIIDARKIKKSENVSESVAKQENGRKLYVKGLIMNLINPKIIIFFLALFTPFLSGDELEAQNEMIILGLIMTVITIVVFGSAAILCSKIRSILSEKNMARMPYISFVIYLGIIAMILS
ncbi:MAG: LysE family translocator [Rikenellaceae bacterium]